MKDLQRFLGLIGQFITLGERFATGISTVGAEYTFSYDPETRSFEAVSDGVIKVHYNDYSKAFVNQLNQEDILCALEAMEDVLSDLTNGNFVCVAINKSRQSLPPHILANPRKQFVSNTQKQLRSKILEIIKAYPCGVHLISGTNHIHYNGRTRLFTITHGSTLYARYNALTNVCSYYFPDNYYASMEDSLNYVLRLANS